MRQTIDVEIIQMTCGECGIHFWVEDNFYKERNTRHLGWCCPNGHNRIFSRNDNDILKEQLAEKERKLANAQFELMAAEKKVKQLEKRAKNGVCPCCHRQFVSVARHMKTKHPDFVDEK